VLSTVTAILHFIIENVYYPGTIWQDNNVLIEVGSLIQTGELVTCCNRSQGLLLEVVR